MSEASEKSVLEIHEEFLQRVEQGGAKIRALSIMTVIVAGLLAISYLLEIILPYAGGGAVQTVNLTDPVLVGFEVLLLILALVWLYVGLSDYRFVSGLSRSIASVRAKEKELERSFTGQESGG